MPRLFVGTPLAPHLDASPALDELGDLQGLKPVDPALYHVTLAFVGNVDGDRVEPARRALREAAKGHHARSGRVRGLGAFPTPTRASVLWAGIEGADLDPLARAVRSALDAAGVPFDDRPFHGHLTLTRLRSKTNLSRLVHRHEDLDLGPLEVDALHLYESTLSPQGPRYETVERAPLEEPS